MPVINGKVTYNMDKCDCGRWKHNRSKCCLACHKKREEIAGVFYIHGEPCRLLPLTQGQYAIVDLILYPRLMRLRWTAVFSPHTGSYYAVAIVKVAGKRSHIPLSNYVLGFNQSGKIVDHINGQSLDDRISNLRPCTSKQNSWNRRIPSSNSSGFKGVSFYGGRYVASIETDGKKYYLGGFASAVEAARAYDHKALELFGEFARVNFAL